MKRIIVVLLALLLTVTGCSFRPGNYPRVEPAGPPAVQPVTIYVTLPQNADSATASAMVLLEAKLIELSGGNVKLEQLQVADVSRAMQDKEPGLYLLSSEQVVHLDKRLSFIQMPFLFDNAQQQLTLLNSEEGVVRSSPVTRRNLGGEVVGVYYGGTTWFLGKGRFYDEVGFYNSVGVLSDMPGNSCFSAIGAETVMEGTAEELFAAFKEGKIKYCELHPQSDIPPEAQAMVKNLELTNHRFDTRWMILCDPEGSLSPTVKSMIKEAFSYTIQQHNVLQTDADIARMAHFEEQMNLTVQEDADYSGTRTLASRYYREKWQSLSIPSDIWQAISLIKGH
ncbi:MAG: hypothetical protein RSD74_07170 [Angelakisella sp.]